MTRKLNILIVDDSEDDVLLTIRELRQGGYDPSWKRVDTAGGMAEALEQGQWDLIISDHQMPNFDSLGALETLNSSGKDIPFIIVSGMIGEDTAVLAMKSGADDYLRKDNLKRLVPAIERELEDVGIRRKKRVVEDRLQKSEARYRMLFARMMDGFALLEYMDTGADRAPDFIFIDLNDAFASTLGLTREDIIAKTVREVYPEVMEELLVRYRSVALTGESMHFEQYSPASRNYFEISAYRPRAGQVATIIKDVTARKVESERQALLGYILETINREANTQTIIQDIISLIKHHYGFDAVGLRFRQNGDYPYYEHDGLSDAFLETEISLCSRDELGAPLSDSDGTPSLECLCGIVLKGKPTLQIRILRKAAVLEQRHELRPRPLTIQL